MAVVPTPVPVSPADFLGLEAVDFGGGSDGGIGIRVSGPSVALKRMRRQRRGPRARRQCGCSGRESNGELKKVAAFHDISLFVTGE